MLVNAVLYTIEIRYSEKVSLKKNWNMHILSAPGKWYNFLFIHFLFHVGQGISCFISRFVNHVEQLLNVYIWYFFMFLSTESTLYFVGDNLVIFSQLKIKAFPKIRLKLSYAHVKSLWLKLNQIFLLKNEHCVGQKLFWTTSITISSIIWILSIFWSAVPLLGWGVYDFEPMRTCCTLDYTKGDR